MKKSSILLLGLLVVAIVVVATMVARYLPGVVPYWQCSEVYKKYSRVEGVRATYVKDYRVNDTLTVGVTLLEATDSAGWACLKEDYGLTVIPRELEVIYRGDSNRVLVKKYPKREPLYSGGDTLADDIVAISYYKHSIIHFIVECDEQKEIIMHKQFDENLKSSNHEKGN